MKVYVGLGSNIGNRAANIKKACKHLANIPDCKVNKISSLYETSPIGPKQRDYINAAAKLETELSPFLLLKEFKRIEQKMGRKINKKRWTPRIIDLDILFYGNKVIKKPGLTVPHKEMQNRSFVLEPLAEISQGFVHPVYKISVKKMAGQLLKRSGCGEMKCKKK